MRVIAFAPITRAETNEIDDNDAGDDVNTNASAHRFGTRGRCCDDVADAHGARISTSFLEATPSNIPLMQLLRPVHRHRIPPSWYYENFTFLQAAVTVTTPLPPSPPTEPACRSVLYIVNFGVSPHRVASRSYVEHNNSPLLWHFNN